MKNSKVIKNGAYAGLTQFTAETMERKEHWARTQSTIPVIEYPTVVELSANLTPPWCCSDMEKCPAPCGACLYGANASTTGVRFTHFQAVLDVEKYQKQQAAHMRLHH